MIRNPKIIPCQNPMNNIYAINGSIPDVNIAYPVYPKYLYVNKIREVVHRQGKQLLNKL
jgi:hypothetical protein